MKPIAFAAAVVLACTVAGLVAVHVLTLPPPGGDAWSAPLAPGSAVILTGAGGRSVPLGEGGRVAEGAVGRVLDDPGGGSMFRAVRVDLAGRPATIERQYLRPISPEAPAPPR